MCSPNNNFNGRLLESMASPALAMAGKPNPWGLKFTPANQPQAPSQISNAQQVQKQLLINQQPIQNSTAPIESATKVAPKFNFRSNPFSIQQEQAGSESGLNLG